jgi:hypothetical protein
MQTPPLIFPLRPLKSPKAKQHKSAQLLCLEKNENPTKTKSRFSGGYFRIQTSAASSAKKPSWSSLFQRLPTAPIGLARLADPKATFRKGYRLLLFQSPGAGAACLD